MARAHWTYELPPVTGDSVWLEEYLVYDRDSEPAGKVFAVLDHGGERFLGVEREHLPLRHDRRALAFTAIREVDHENLVVHVTLSAAEIADALELDPARGVEQGGEARRVVDVPLDQLPRRADAAVAGPTDRPQAILAPIVALFATLALLGVFVFWGISRSSSALPWLALPGALFLVAGVLAVRAWGRPSA
jgi:hypothetical protein